MTEKASPAKSSNAKLQECLCSHPEETTPRNLVVCIDGTSNQFGTQNTNIVELYRCLAKDKTQITYYNSGTGTHTKRASLLLPLLINFLDKTIDSAIAWNFQENVTCAYRWLSEQYEEGDRIFLFGFSRGAYQVRALAGMINEVGLIPAGNWEQIPFAYDFYASDKAKAKAKAEDFRRTFSRDARVHFVGVWDTVSSVGIVRGKNLPYTETSDHICFFRHALALDECRVKFLPEYIKEHPEPIPDLPPRVKEVWFAGSHSDVGGRLAPQSTSTDTGFAKDVRNMSLLWMQNEAGSAGLRLEQSVVDWDFSKLRDEKPTKSLILPWWMLEISLVRRQKRSPKGITRVPHLGRGRAIHPKQTIHFSVAFKDKTYKPKAILKYLDPSPLNWESLIGLEASQELVPVGGWEGRLELDLFGNGAVDDLIGQLAQEKPPLSPDEVIHRLHRLNSMVAFQSGRKAIIDTPGALSTIAKQLFKQDSNKVASELLKELLPATCLPKAICLLTDMLEDDAARSTAAKLLKLLPENTSWLDKTLPLVNGDDMKEVLKGFVLYEANRSADNAEFPIPVHKAIPRLIEMLEADGPRDAAVEVLEIFVRHGTDIRSTPEFSFESSVTHPLFDKLKGDDGVRTAATKLLKRFAECDDVRASIFTPSVVHLLAKMLTDDVDGIRSAAVELLEALALRRDVFPVSILESNVNPALVKMLQGGDGLKRAVAKLIQAFAMRDDIRALIVKSSVTDSLAKMLKSDDNRARSSAIELCKAFALYPDIVASILESDVILSLVKMLDGDSERMQCMTVELFTAFVQYDNIRATILDCNVVGPIIKLIEAKDDDVRSQAAGLLKAFVTNASVFKPDAIVALVKILNNDDRGVRTTAAELFKTLAQDHNIRASVIDGDAIRLVVKMLEARNDGVRSTAAGLLKYFSQQEDVRAPLFTSDVIFSLAKVLEANDHNARNEAVDLFKAVAQHHDVRASIVGGDAIRSVVKMLEAPDDGVRSAAAGLLQEFALQDDVRTSIFTLDVISSLAKTLERDKNGARSPAVELFKALAQYHDVLASILKCDAIQSVVKMLKAQDGVRSAAAGLLKKFAVHDDVRASNFESIVILPVLGMLEDSHAGVRTTAAELLKEFAIHDGVLSSILGSHEIPRVVKMLEASDEGVRSTASGLLKAFALHDDIAPVIGSNVIPPVVKMLEARDDGVRSTASGFLKAFALHDDIRVSILESRVIPQLVEMLENTDDDVRSTVAGLLKGFALHDDVRISIFKSSVIPKVAKIMVEDHNDNVRRTAAELLHEFALHDDVRASIWESNQLHQFANRNENDDRATANNVRGASSDSVVYFDASETISLDSPPNASSFSSFITRVRSYFVGKEDHPRSSGSASLTSY